MKNCRAKSFVTIMIFIAIFAFLLRFAVSQIIKISIPQNESSAQATLKLISTALENYAKDNQGAYPKSMTVLTQTKPPYLDKDYILRSSLKGYSYSCSRMEPSGYSCTATPLKCMLSGTKIYAINTGGLFMVDECSKKE